MGPRIKGVTVCVGVGVEIFPGKGVAFEGTALTTALDSVAEIGALFGVSA
jgi:hypothetical protein